MAYVIDKELGGFNWYQSGQLLPGFNISTVLGPKFTLKMMETAVSIARGDHGFGPRINRENPFIFAPIMQDERELDQIVNTIQHHFSNDPIVISPVLLPSYRNFQGAEV